MPRRAQGWGLRGPLPPLSLRAPAPLMGPRWRSWLDQRPLPATRVSVIEQEVAAHAHATLPGRLTPTRPQPRAQQSPGKSSLNCKDAPQGQRPWPPSIDAPGPPEFSWANRLPLLPGSRGPGKSAAPLRVTRRGLAAPRPVASPAFRDHLPPPRLRTDYEQEALAGRHRLPCIPSVCAAPVPFPFPQNYSAFDDFHRSSADGCEIHG